MASGDIVLSSDVANVVAASSDKPIVRLVQSAGQSIPHNVGAGTPVTFTSESIDTDNFFNAASSTSRVTPSKPGYYRARGAVFLVAAADFTTVNCWVRKNGSVNHAPAGRLGGRGAQDSAGGAQIVSVECEAFVDCNGTTDYVELVSLHANVAVAARNTNVSGQFSSTFELEFVRDY